MEVKQLKLDPIFKSYQYWMGKGPYAVFGVEESAWFISPKVKRVRKCEEQLFLTAAGAVEDLASEVAASGTKS